MFDFLSDNLLIICPYSYKLAILKYLKDNNKILNIKFMTISEYLKKLFFDYDEKAIHYLVKLGMKVDNAKIILNNLYYIEDKKYYNDKLDYLVEIKHELDNNNLLIYDKFFSKLLKRFKVVVYGYGKLDLFNSNIFSNATIIPYEVIDKKYDIYHFKTINNEVEFVFQKICDLLNEGIDISKISLMNIDDDYTPYIKMMEKFYGIKVNLNNSDTLMGTIIGKKFYDSLSNNKTKEEILEELSVYEDENEYAFIINLLNKYDDLFEYKEEIKDELLNHKIKSNKLSNAINVKNVFDYVSDDEYVFLLNFNGSIPKLKMDTDYITNDICTLVGKEEIKEANELIKVNTLNYLSSISNIIISYKDASAFNLYYPSILLDYMDYEIKEYERSFNYSDLANKTLYTTYLDDYVKYGIKNKDLDLLYQTYDQNNYLEYDNQFTRINKDNLIKYLNNELTLSYSSLDNYYECSFKYYLTNILKIDIFNETFDTLIGKLFHYVLSKMNEPNFNLDNEYNYFLKEYQFTNREKFFLDKLKDDLAFVIETIRKHQFISGFTNMLYEKKLDITLMNNPYVHLKGYIDKIMYKEKDNETLVSIIDYKTGKADITIKNIKFGLSMQLAIYFYLIKNSDVLKNPKFTGIYLEHILNLDNKKSDKKTLEELKYDSLKLSGYTTSEISRLEVFDSTYKDSKIIKGMKINQDGSISKLSKSLTDAEIEDILKIVDKKISEAIGNILEGKYFINPKIINGKNVSCEYCHFKDICYHEDKNNVYLKNSD